jgi:DNA (cytosine-5)-methyltransferase 1
MQSPETDFRKLRESAGLSLEEVAVRTTYTVRTIQRWERGETVPRKPVIEMLQDIAQERFEAQGMQPNTFTFIDLFAGIGGMRKGFESIGGECVATCEWNKYARETYAANFETANHPFFWDIQEIPAKNFPRHDVLLAGFPCQPFSIAGVSKKNALGMPHGFKCADQGNLFFDIVRILDHHRPAAFLLENVKNLVSHDGGLTFKVIIDALRDGLGYTVDWKVINAKAFVPQHRERTFIVGTRKDTGFRFKDISVPDPAKGPKIKSILHPDSEVDSKYTLTPKLWKYLQDYAAKHRAAGNGFGYGLVGPEDTARTLSARYYKDGSEILVRQKKTRPRRLTPRECARLMGFDNDTHQMKIPVSDTQAYKQFGNAVVVPVVSFLAREMLPHIMQLAERKTLMAAE